jgi:hypothetical protein
MFALKPCVCGSNLPVIEISGRAGEPLCMNGKSIAFPVVYILLKDIPDLMNWQIIKTSECSAEFRLQEAYGTNRAEIANIAISKLKKLLRTHGCGDIDIMRSDDAFLKNQRGGKTPHIVSKS